MNRPGFLVLGFVALAAAIGGAVWRFGVGPREANAAAEPARQEAVPISAAPAKVGDIPVYLRGLGSVQAFRSDEIRAEVNGVLVALPAREGQEVKVGDVVAEIDPRPYQAALDQATAQRAGDVASLQSAQADLQRYTSLAKTNFAPIQQVDDQRATVNKLIASIQADSAAIETAKLNLSFCAIRAPIDGRVSLIQTDVGNLIEVANQTNIISIAQDKPISVVFTLPESALGQVQDAMAKDTLPVLAYSSNDATRLSDGQLLAPNNTIDTTTGTIQFKATFQNADDKLWPGQFVSAWLQVTTLHNAVNVPLTAVQHGPNGLFVYVVKPDSTVAQQTVEEGYIDGSTAVITRGLTGGENIVLSGQSRLSPGTRVAIQTPRQAPDTSSAPISGPPKAG